MATCGSPRVAGANYRADRLIAAAQAYAGAVADQRRPVGTGEAASVGAARAAGATTLTRPSATESG